MFTEKDFEVTLMNKSDIEHFIRRHGEFACVCYNTPIGQADKVGEHCLQSGHLSGSRHLYFVFKLKNIPRFTVDQLVRHEAGVVKNVQSLRYVTKYNFSVYMPPEIEEDLMAKWEHSRAEDYLQITYNKTVRDLAPKVGKERANEIARTFLPIGIATECSFACNLEGLINLANKRLCNRAERPIHVLVKMMVNEVIAVEPRYKEFLVPQCKKLGYCPEMKGCGMYEQRKSKSDRELIADLTDRTKLFCDSYYDPKTWGCNGCPLIHFTEFTDCRIAYIHYLLEGDKNE